MTPLHIALAVLVTFIWGVNFTFMAWSLESFPPLMLSALRFFFTAVPLVLFLKPPKFNRTLFIYAIGTFVVQYAFVFTAMHLGASPGLTALLLQLQIFITVLLAYVILGEAVSRIQIVGMLVGVLGLGVIVLNLGGDMPLVGFVCILIAAIGWSFGNIASKQASTQAALKATQPGSIISTATGKNKASALSALALVVWGGLIACIVLTLSSLIFESNSWQLATFTEASLKSWLALGFIVYISTLVGFGLWAHLLSQNTASKVIPFALLVPIFGMATSVLLTGEMVTWWKMLAMILILLGLVLANVKIRLGRKPQSA
jgi:O-acetylserine/cysteine efflux transporter